MIVGFIPEKKEDKKIEENLKQVVNTTVETEVKPKKATNKNK